jgi:cytochrome c oxidase assembly protein subunit 15
MSTGLALVDLSPAVSVALIGAVVACVPLGVVAWRRRSVVGIASGAGAAHDWLRALTLATLFLTLDLVVFGAFTRLTDSGLGCPDWPGCYGSTSPVGAHGDIAEAQAALPHGPVTHTKAWIEMLHRYLATGVGAMITWLMGLAWWQHARRAQGTKPSISPWWPTAAFVWVCAQGAFGALTVTLKLYPLVVTGHLLGGLMGVALLTAQVRAMTPTAPEHAEPSGMAGIWSRPLPAALRRCAVVVLAVWFGQVILGGWVSTNAAVLACADFPTCHGQWWPDMDFAQGFTLMRGLGQSGQGGAISLQALMAIHMKHRLGAVLVTVAMLWLAWRASRVPGQGAALDARVLVALWLFQVASGLSNVVLGWPLAAALAHTLGAALTVAWLTRMVVAPATGSVVTSPAATAARGASARWAW